jgi:hypothetical protein
MYQSRDIEVNLAILHLEVGTPMHSKTISAENDIIVEFTSQNIALGRCVKPNICICEDGRIAPSCAEAGSEDQAQDCSGKDEDTHSLYANRHSFDVELHSYHVE